MLSVSPLNRLPVLTEKEMADGTLLDPPHFCELRERTRKDMTLLLLLLLLSFPAVRTLLSTRKT